MTSGFVLPDLIQGGERISADRLGCRVDAAVQQLLQAGVAAGHAVAVIADDPLEVLVMRQALDHLQAGLLPLAPGAQDLGTVLPAWGVQWWWQAGAASHVDGVGRGTSNADIRLLVPSSGSSGRPRAAMHTGEALRAAARRVNAKLVFGPEDGWLACLPLHHMGGLAILERCSLAGGALCLHPGFDVAAVAKALSSGRISHVSLVPAMLWRLLEAGVRPPGALRVALIGGQALTPALARRARSAGWPLCVSYGMTETGGLLSCETGSGAGEVAGRVGEVLPDAEIRITAAGSVALRGPMLMCGYANPLGQPGEGLSDGWFVSGDLGEVDGDGRLWIQGRRDDVLVSGGVNVHPAEVEAKLAGVPGLGEVAVTGVADPVWGMRLVLFYTGAMAPAEAGAVCRERLSGALRPRGAVRIAELPLRGPGKLDRRRLASIGKSLKNIDISALQGYAAKQR